MSDWQDRRGPGKRGPGGPKRGGGGRDGGRDGGGRDRDGERPSRGGFGGKRGSDDRPPRKAFGDKPPRREFSDRPPRKEFSDRPPRREFGDRPQGEKRFGDRPARGGFGDRKEFGEKRSFRPRFEDDRGGERPRKRPERPAVPRRGDPEKLARKDHDGLDRIAKVIARAGIASRRDAEVLIEQGRVTLDGEPVTSPALDVAPDADIRIDGEKLPSRERTRLWLFHKPVGLVSTTRDPEGRPTVFEALPEDLPRVMTVGRLDINTEGLLLFSNDGGLARVLSHPETGWLRRYRVRAYGHVDVKRLEELRHGVTIDGEEYGPIVATLDREQGDNTWLTLDLREGRNREVKKVLEHVGLMVNRLIRISFGPFQLGDLKEGDTEEVPTKVLREQLGEQLARIAEVEFDGPVRTPAGPAKPKREDGDRPSRGRFGEDRPRRSFDDERPRRREEAREERPDLLLRKRGGTKSEIWRDEETKGMKPRRAAPRRGADPREDRERRDGEDGRIRTRAKPIEDASGRRVSVERVSGPSPEIERKPRYSREDFRGDRDERPSRGPRRDFGDRPPRREFGDRPPRKEFGDRPPRRDFSDRPPRKEFGDRPQRSFRPREDGDRPFRARGGEDRPFRRSEGDRGPRRDFGDRPPRKEFGDRPPRRDFGDRPPRKDFGDRPARSVRPREDGDKPFRKRFDDDRAPRGEGRPFRRDDRDGERRGPPKGRGRFGGKPGGFKPGGGSGGGSRGGSKGGGFGGDRPRGPRKPR